MRSVFDATFTLYGRVIEGYDWQELLETMNRETEKPMDRTLYEPSIPALEALPVFEELSCGCYGGMPVQIGCCNGSNKLLNCLEYHRGSEVNVAADDVVLLVAAAQKLRDFRLDTGAVEAFALPAGCGVLLYETTLHYAPCNAPGQEGFRVAIVLPRGTNTEMPVHPVRNSEDALLWARNKWLIAHPASDEAAQGAFCGLDGENILVK